MRGMKFFLVENSILKMLIKGYYNFSPGKEVRIFYINISFCFAIISKLYKSPCQLKIVLLYSCKY